MPKLLDPDCTFDVILAGDAGKDDPPTFIFKALSARQFTQVVETYEAIDDEDGDVSRVETIVSLLKVGMVGWSAMAGREYDPSTLADILTIGEAIELLERMLSGHQLDVDEAKN